MVADVRIKDNSVQVRKSLLRLSKKVPQIVKKALSNAVAFQVASIKKRTTEKGVDFRGRAFKPYSKNYKRRLVKQSGVVDLKDTGQMFSSLSSKVTPSKGELFFLRKTENDKAFFHDVVGVGKSRVIRPFFRINKKEETNIEKIFFNVLERELRLWVKEKI